MRILILLVFALARPAFAQVGNPLYSAYCAALLENQRPIERETSLDFTRALHQVLLRAEVLNAFNETPAEELADESEPLALLTFGPNPTPVPSGTSRDDARVLRRIPARILDLQSHVSSVQDGVVAAGLMIRGEENILKYIGQVRATTARNDEALVPVAREVLPHFTKTRTFVAVLATATPLIPAGVIGGWLAPSVLDLNVSAMQMIVGAVAIPAGYFSVRFLLDMPVAYAKGFLAEHHRVEFDRTYGRRSMAPEYRHLKSLAKVARRARGRPRTLAYFTHERTFGPDDVVELKNAAAESRPPSPEFLVRQERSELSRELATAGQPLTYKMVVDQISYFDEKLDDPVLLTFVRFIRNFSAPTKPRNKTTEQPSRVFDFGGLRPAGV